jgi:hypothetical protein
MYLFSRKNAEPGSRFLHLAAHGRKAMRLRVFDIETAVVVFGDFRDFNSFGASDLKAECGKITDENDNELCRISYNGRVWLPNGQALDGMDGSQWIAYASGKPLTV